MRRVSSSALFVFSVASSSSKSPRFHWRLEMASECSRCCHNWSFCSLKFSSFSHFQFQAAVPLSPYSFLRSPIPGKKGEKKSAEQRVRREGGGGTRRRASRKVPSVEYYCSSVLLLARRRDGAAQRSFARRLHTHPNGLLGLASGHHQGHNRSDTGVI